MKTFRIPHSAFRISILSLPALTAIARCLAVAALCVGGLCAGGCTVLSAFRQFDTNKPISSVAATPAGAQIVASAADKVIQKGLNAGADKLDATGNPYLHSVADAIRANPDGILDPAAVQKIFVNYGDPANKSKFKTLALDVWNVAKIAAKSFTKETIAELLAKGLQDGAGAAPKSTVADGP